MGKEAVTRMASLALQGKTTTFIRQETKGSGAGVYVLDKLHSLLLVHKINSHVNYEFDTEISD